LNKLFVLCALIVFIIGAILAFGVVSGSVSLIGLLFVGLAFLAAGLLFPLALP
jgi:hypothetical protein